MNKKTFKIYVQKQDDYYQSKIKIGRFSEYSNFSINKIDVINSAKIKLMNFYFKKENRELLESKGLNNFVHEDFRDWCKMNDQKAILSNWRKFLNKREILNFEIEEWKWKLKF